MTSDEERNERPCSTCRHAKEGPNNFRKYCYHLSRKATPFSDVTGCVPLLDERTEGNCGAESRHWEKRRWWHLG